MSNSNYFRENIMEANSRAANSRNWQQRHAPLSRAANTRYMTSGAT